VVLLRAFIAPRRQNTLESIRRKRHLERRYRITFLGIDMRNRRSTGFGGPGWGELSPRYRRNAGEDQSDLVPADSNSPEEIFGEIGLVLVVVLGVVLAINMVLVALHIT
jgi:hypothetical protein